MSTALPCPFCVITSGDTYSGVPTKVFVDSLSLTTLEIPKSAN